MILHILLHGVKLRIINAISETNSISEELSWLINESKELKNILGSIVTKTRTKR